MDNPEVISSYLKKSPASTSPPVSLLSPQWKTLLLSQKAKSIFRKVFLFLGLALFAFLIVRLKPSVLLQNLRSFGFNFVYILMVSLLQFLTYTAAWEIFLKTLSKKVHFWEIFKIKVAGEGISSLTPLSWGSGDPVRILLLKNHIPLTEGTASVVVDRTLNALAVALFMLIGILIAFLKFSLTPAVELGLLAILSAMLGSSIFFYIRSHEGLFEFFIDFLKKLKIKKHFSEKTLAHAREIDGHISQFYKMNKKGFLLSFALHFVGKSLGVLEIYLAAFFLGYPIGLLDSYLLLSITVLVNMIFAFVPGSLGVLEGAYAGTFALLHSNPVMGTSIQIIRRTRMIFWTALGFTFLARMKKNGSSGS